MPALLDDVKAAAKTVQPQKEQRAPVKMDETPPCPIDPDKMQAYVDWISKTLTLPTVNAQAPPLEEYINPEGLKKMRPIPACRVDRNGEVIPASGPVVTDGYTEDLWEKCKSHVEQTIHRTLFKMADSLLQTGEVHPRSQVLDNINGRFIIADAQ
jgi:hypothetical protein